MSVIDDHPVECACLECREDLVSPQVGGSVRFGLRLVANKYRNIRTTGYASKLEARRGQELWLLERAGEIQDLRRQVRYELLPKQAGERACTYIADFVYQEDGRTVVEDVKGQRWGAAYNLFVIKRKLMLHVHGIRVIEVG